MTASRIVHTWANGGLLAAVLLAVSPAWALYKVVGPDGQVTYTDRPPANVKAQTIKSGNGNARATDGLPYELQKVVSRFPVVLYSSNACSPCDSARLFLIRRGIPFAEKTVNSNEDYRELKNTLGADQLPALKIGGQQLRGYSESEWSEYLTAAGYPEQSALPSSYRLPEPAPLTTPAPARGEVAPAPLRSTPAPAQPSGSTPPGFRF